MNAAAALAAATALAAMLVAQPARGAGTGTAAFGLPPLPSAADVNASRIELGRKLFFDRRLSFNGTMSCAMCHVPEEGFTTQASRTAVGIEGRSLQRNAPSLFNVAWQRALFHDGRENDLVTQAWSPLLHADEMGNPSIGHVLQRLRELPDYRRRFERAFAGRGTTMETVGRALAAFEATLIAADSRFDRWRYGGASHLLTADEQRGFEIFTGKGGCSRCHRIGARDALFADGRFHVTGVGFVHRQEATYVVPLAPGVDTVLRDVELAAFAGDSARDLGRFEITLDPADRYAFKTPSLRNVARTAPYMHDGSMATLGDVVDFYMRGGGDAPGRSAMLTPFTLDEADKRALLAFLQTLDGESVDTLMRHSRPSVSPLTP